MLTRAAYLLDAVNLRNLCYLYFFISPFLLDRKDDTLLVVLFALGYLVTGTIVVLALAERLSNLSHRVRYHQLTLLVIAILAVMLVTSVFANLSGLFSPTLLFMKYGKVILPALAFLVMINIWSTRDIPVLFSILLGLGILSVGFILIDVVNWLASRKDLLPRVGETMFGDPNKYAVFLNILYALLFAGLLSKWKSARPLGWHLVGVLGVAFLMFFTQSRSGILTFALMTAVCLWAAGSRRIVMRSLLLLLPVVLLFAVAVVIRYSSEVNANLSDLGRIWTYMVAWNVIANHPLVGIGFANTVEMYERYGQLQLMLIGYPLDIHNTILEVFAQQGVVGVLTYLAFVFIPVVLLVRRIRAKMSEGYPVAEVAALAVPLCFFAYGMFYHQYITNEHFWAYMAITFLVLRAPRDETPALRFRFPRLV